MIMLDQLGGRLSPPAGAPYSTAPCSGALNLTFGPYSPVPGAVHGQPGLLISVEVAPGTSWEMVASHG
ncbi:MAG: hypothetical protein ACYCYA_04595 [Actinomycetes bacterium]